MGNSNYYNRYIKNGYNSGGQNTPPRKPVPCRLCFGECLATAAGFQGEFDSRLIAMLTRPDFGGYMNFTCPVYNKTIIRHISEEPYGSENVEEWRKGKFIPITDSLNRITGWEKVTEEFRDWTERLARQRAGWTEQQRLIYLQ